MSYSPLNLFLSACTNGNGEGISEVFNTYPLSVEVRHQGFLLALSHGSTNVLSQLWEMLNTEQQHDVIIQCIDAHLETHVSILWPFLTDEQSLQAYHHTISIQDFNMVDIMWPSIMPRLMNELTSINLVSLESSSTKSTSVQDMRAAIDASDGLLTLSLETGAAEILCLMKIH
jgi:hypothetical protein